MVWIFKFLWRHVQTKNILDTEQQYLTKEHHNKLDILSITAYMQ